jgi:uncharacterized small protein (DUF1192 family)
MGRHAKSVKLIALAAEILVAEHPMTVRQVYYQLVSSQAIENSRSAYQAVCNALRDARLDGIIPWEHIEDRLRKPRRVSMWDDLAAFGEAVRRSYRRNVWNTQPCVLEAWLEKDALSGIFEKVLEPYGVTLNVGRGYDGWSSIHEAAERFGNGDGSCDLPPVSVIYFGDHDPSGEDMLRSLRERLAVLGSHPEIDKVAILREDIERYDLPPDFAKKSDTRAAAFIETHGDQAVELDALPVAVLRQRLKEAVEARMDLGALAAVRRAEKADLRRLDKVLRWRV